MNGENDGKGDDALKRFCADVLGNEGMREYCGDDVSEEKRDGASRGGCRVSRLWLSE